MGKMAIMESEFEPLDYAKLTKQQKLAVFLITIGPEAASQVLKSFNDFEIEAIVGEVALIPMVEKDIQDQIVEEFSSVIGESLGAILGGTRFAQRALEMSKGDYKAANILSRISPGSSTSDMIKEVSEMEPRQLFNLIRHEQPQTIAFIASQLVMEKSVAVIEMLAPEKREEVIERIGVMDATSLEIVKKVILQIKSHTDAKEQPTLQKAGGLRQVADILNSLEKETSKALLGRLEERNPGLGQQIRKKMFSFEDLVRLQISDLQRVTREVEMADLVLALKAAPQQLSDMIFKSVSKRAAETLKDEMDMLGAVKMKEVEAAQDRVIQIVRRLEEEEEISLDAEGDRVG